MRVKTFLSGLLFSATTLAQTTPITEKSLTEADVIQLKRAWQTEQNQAGQQREKQRQQFLQLENLINQAIRQEKMSDHLIDLATRLAPADYPLQEEIDWLLLKAKLAHINPENLTQRLEEIHSFSQTYPKTAARHQLAQRPFALYAQYGKDRELVDYAQTTPAIGAENQCRFLNSEARIIDEKFKEMFPDTTYIEAEKRLDKFEQLWQNSTLPLPAECNSLLQQWQDKGRQTLEKTHQKIIDHFAQNKTVLNIDDQLDNIWISDVEQLRLDPRNLPIFIEKQTVNQTNKALIIAAFPAFVKTLPEQTGQEAFSQYLVWAEKFGLTSDEIRQWQILFLTRTFDNPSAEFQAWRDNLLKELRVDTLTERRIRTAIWQKTDLNLWLALLSEQAAAKQEWRYWAAKSSPTQRETQLSALSQERGFYPMLAAHLLGKSYTQNIPSVAPLTDAQYATFRPQLDRIDELRRLNRFEQAKSVWITLLQAVGFEEKLALSQFALAQDWADLSVEGTIQSKAWDYLSLRLPATYADLFRLTLKNSPVSLTFAMAIARQESALNPQARSHANAIGLMQLLPSTAKQTAENNRLPFGGEQDLTQAFPNILLGTTHLGELFQKYPDNRILIAAAYNAGASRVAKWLERAGGRLAMDEFIASIPFLETRGYVQNVLAYDYYYQTLLSVQPLMMFSEKEQLTY